MRFFVGILAAMAAALPACGPSDETNRAADVGPLEGPFYVSDHFSPSGHMGDGQEPGHIKADIAEHCKARPEGAGGACYRFTYTPGEMLWAGVYWVFPANSWGSRPGRDVVTKYNKVRFYAATEAEELSVEFIAGGINDPTLEHRDTFRVSTAEKVGREFKQFTLDLSKRQFTAIIGAFAWVTSYPPETDASQAEPQVIYLDDIVWE